VRVSGAWLLGGLSRLIRICGMGRGLLVDVAITSVSTTGCLSVPSVASGTFALLVQTT
jgi:hypothetical protein